MSMIDPGKLPYRALQKETERQGHEAELHAEMYEHEYEARHAHDGDPDWDRGPRGWLRRARRAVTRK